LHNYMLIYYNYIPEILVHPVNEYA
jgi:hypothetical protein